MPKSRIPSPARSQSALVTPRRQKHKGPRSVGSPARSNTSVRLTSVIQNFKDKNVDSFRLSPLTSRRSVLNDNTDIEEPRRQSWWKNLNDTSRDILEVFENETQDGVYNVIEEYMDVEILSQEKKAKQETLDLPDSSDSESIRSIVIPQRKLFTQKENQPKNKFTHLLGTRETISKHDKTNIESDKNDKTIRSGTKKLFGQSSKPKSKPAFPTELLRFSPDKTANKTAGEVKGQVRNLFGNRVGVKRKNKFADFIASESEDEPEIQPKVFGFQKKLDLPNIRVSTASRGTRDPSPTSSVTTDIDMEDWKLLPSSTMVQTQLEAMMADTPAKKARLSKLSEGKESEAATNSTAISHKTKQSNKSLASKNKSKLSTSKTKTSPEVNTSVRKSSRNTAENKNDDQDIQLEDNEEQDRDDNAVQPSVNAIIKKSKKSNKSVNEKNKSQINNTKSSSNKSIKSIENEVVPDNDDQNLEFDVDEMPNDIVTVEDNNDRSKQSKSIVLKNTSQTTKSSLNKSKTSPKVNKSVQQSMLKDVIPENKDQEMELQIGVEKRAVPTNAEQNDESHISNKSNKEQSNESATTINKSKMSNSKMSFNKSKTSPKANKPVQKLTVNVAVPENEEQEMDLVEMDTAEDEKPNKVPEGNQASVNDNVDKSNKSSISNLQETFNKNRTASYVNANENFTKFITKEAVPETDDQEIETDDNEEIRLSLNYSDEEPMEQETENISKNVSDGNKVGSEDEDDAVDNSKEISDKNVQNDNKIINESVEINDSEEKEDEKEDDIRNESRVSDHEKSDTEADNEEENQEMDKEDESQEVEIDDPNETKEDNELIDEENISQEVETEDPDETEDEDNEEEIEVEEENESQENQDPSQEIEESHEGENEGEVSENEENESQEIVNDSDGDERDEVIDESDGQNGEITSDEENPDISGTEEEMPNLTHDTTGRNRKKDETNVKSPEAVLKNDYIDHMESFTAKGRNKSIRRTSMIENLNIKPSLPSPRVSTGFSDAAGNSSAEGSGWDSHRTTRKTLRQTFGRDFTPRKSLRALVMEKSAKRHTVFNDVGMPRANSTELPDASNSVDVEYEDPHEISKRTRQTTLEMYLQKIKKQNFENKKKLEEEVRNSLTAPSKDIFDAFKMPSRPFVLKRATKPGQSKSKPKTIKSTIPLENLPQDLLEDMKYKPPKRFQPSNASWITKRLYKFLETKLEPKYDYEARVRAEKLVETMYNFVRDLRRHEVAPHDAVEVLKREMARLSVVTTHFEFYQFFHDYLPREVRVKVVPDVVNKIPLPRHGVFTEILRGNTVQG